MRLLRESYTTLTARATERGISKEPDPLGDRAWLTEALRLAGEDGAVEVRLADV